MGLVLEGVVKRFDGRAAVAGVDLDAPPGAFVAILGPSGCGKSTLLRLIAGLETLDAGRILLDGRPVAGPGLHLAPEDRGVGVVFQSYALWPHMSVLDNVAFPIEATGGARAAAREAARGHLRAVALDDLADRKPAALSGGQRQRAALARCLASKARTVLMDEPLANLDPHLRAAMEEELTAFHARAGVTTFYITHDQREAMALGHLVAVMREGRFEQVAPPAAVYSRPATEHVARFVGRAAVLDATLERVEGARALARVGGEAVEVECPSGARPGPARLVVRPEDVVIGDGDWAPARIDAAVYRGGVWEARLQAAALAEALPVATPTRPPSGAVGFRIVGGWVLPGHDPQGGCAGSTPGPTAPG